MAQFKYVFLSPHCVLTCHVHTTYVVHVIYIIMPCLRGLAATKADCEPHSSNSSMCRMHVCHDTALLID